MKTVQVLNVEIDNLSTLELLKQIDSRGGTVFTPNVDHLIKLQKDPEFYNVYKSSTYRVCDSRILVYVSKFLGQPIREKISGSDLFPAFYTYYSKCDTTKIFLLGAAEGVAKKAQNKINHNVGRKIVVDSYSPPFGFETDEEECQNIIDRINRSGATVVAVGLGAPKQEKWIAKYKHQLKKIKTFLAIGATIDFEAGEKPRAPKWMSELGLEWLYRLLTEPKRLWKRYLVEDLPFFWLVLKQKLNLYQAPCFSSPELAVSTASPSPVAPLGQVLQQAGLISLSQVKLVLKEQTQQKHLRFGEILAAKGWLKQETIDFFAEQLPRLSQTKYQQPLGHYLKLAQLLDDQQIEAILAEQRQVNLRFGEVAVKKGWVKSETIDSLLGYLSNPAESSIVNGKHSAVSCQPSV